jgi:hypothetical protein
MTLSAKWSKDTLPVHVHSTGLFFWVIAPAAWLGLLLFSLLVVLPEAARTAFAQATLMIALMLIGSLLVWLIKLFRRTFRASVRVTSAGVERTRGKSQEFDPYLQCSNFVVFGWTLQWKAMTNRGIKLRTMAGLSFGMSRRDLKALCVLLNALREAAIAQSQSA